MASTPKPAHERELLYGRQAVYECLRAGRRTVHRLLSSAPPGRGGTLEEIAALARSKGFRPEPVEKRVLDRMTHSGNHQGVAVEVSPYPLAEPGAMLAAAEDRGEPPFLLLLDHLQDPQNLGSIFRTAEAAGVHGIVLPKDRAAGVTPAVVRASSGATEHMLCAQVPNIVQVMRILKERGLWLFGLEGVPEAPALTTQRLTGPAGLVVGSEGAGVSRLVRDTCDILLRIPMRGRVASLNAAVATAIALYEIRRQRDAAPPGG